VDKFSAKLQELRRTSGLTQVELAKRVGVSQGTISRLESSDGTPDIRLVARVAKAFNEPLANLIPESIREAILNSQHGDQFFAFCGNPFCKENNLDLRGREPMLYWKSGSSYPVEQFDEVNFCTRCGKELVKECPSCKRRLDRAGIMFCITCGTQISPRPTAEDMKEISRRYVEHHNATAGERNVPASDEAQFNEDDIPF